MRRAINQTLPLAVVLLAGLPVAALAASATGSASANIVTPLSITSDNDLAFGSIAVGAGGGTVVIDAAGNRSASGDVQLASGTVGVAARFRVAGEGGAGYSVTLPAAINIDDGTGNTMQVDGFTSTASTGGVLNAQGQQDLEIGATLNVPPGQPVGTYSGSFTVTVDYN